MKNYIKSIWGDFIKGGQKKIFIRVSTLILAIVVIFSGVMSIKTLINKRQAKQQYEALQELAKIMEEEKPLVTEIPDQVEPENIDEKVDVYELVSEYPKLELDYPALEEINSDMVGWIYLPALELSYPVVHYKDNAYYLEHSFEKVSSILGCIFIDYESPEDWTDFNTLIFGHNMRDLSMFGALKRFVREDGLLESDPYIYIYTEEEVLIYRIFSMYIAVDGSQRYRIVQDEADLAWYVQEAKDLSEYDSGVEFEQMEHVISLSTCYGTVGTSNRLLIHGVLIERGVREK